MTEDRTWQSDVNDCSVTSISRVLAFVDEHRYGFDRNRLRVAVAEANGRGRVVALVQNRDH